jgi:N-acetylglutamate synthase-like GNAT family acetyltransferase
MGRLTPVSVGDPSFRSRLEAHHLPVSDLDDAALQAFAWAEGDGVEGYGAMLRSGADALLRSVVVAGPHGQGAGRRTVQALAAHAGAHGVERLWLLTNDAQAFFAALGWTAVARDSAPAALAGTSQFRSTCPASATLMVRRITP